MCDSLEIFITYLCAIKEIYRLHINKQQEEMTNFSRLPTCTYQLNFIRNLDYLISVNRFDSHFFQNFYVIAKFCIAK